MDSNNSETKNNKQHHADDDNIIFPSNNNDNDNNDNIESKATTNNNNNDNGSLLFIVSKNSGLENSMTTTITTTKSNDNQKEESNNNDNNQHESLFSSTRVVIINNDEKSEKKSHKRRGMKPKSKRNRKRARSELHSIQNQTYNTSIVPLQINDNSNKQQQQQQKVIKIDTSTGWLRIVEPYPYTFSTFAKARWLGRTLLNVYHEEFGSYPKSYYETAIMQGRILVSDQKVNCDYIIKGGDVLTHTVHRHEPAVAVEKDAPHVKIIVNETNNNNNNNDVVVVDKPATLPIHPCGGYHIQSLMNILEPTFGKLYTIHRLDRLTSGLVILGKSSQVAQEWGKCIKHRDCQKIYLARVKGKFPTNCPSNLLLSKQGQDTIPINGEWNNKQQAVTKPNNNNNNNNDTESPSTSSTRTTAPTSAVTIARQQNAYCVWVSDIAGKPIFTTMTGQQFAESASTQSSNNYCNDIDQWLNSLQLTEPIGTSTTTTSSSPAFATTSTTHDTKANKSNNNLQLLFNLACPTRIAQPKDGVCEAGEFTTLDDDTYLKTVKPAESAFGIVRYDHETDTTIILCLPKTGRTHQLRLHLQHLGHPIANDPNYGGNMWYGNPTGQDACKIAQGKLNDALEQENLQNVNDDDNNNNNISSSGDATNQADVCPNDDGNNVTTTAAALDVPATEDEIKNVTGAIQDKEESIHDFIKRTCVWCARSGKLGHERSVLEFLIRSPGIWLHALQYSYIGNDKVVKFRTLPPAWATIK